MSVKLITSTPDPETIMGYCARASSPKNQARMEAGELTAAGLLKHCAEAGHWSVFTMANVVFEVNTSRAISAQILRHWSLDFQEFSQRYAKVDFEVLEIPELREAGASNRQSSLDVIDDPETNRIFQDAVRRAFATYDVLLSRGVANESARMVLPMCSPTKLYINGTVRSWIHYLDVRCKSDVQKEHRVIAEEIRRQLCPLLPTCAEAFNWKEES